MKSYWFLFWACAVIWGFLSFYMLMMLFRQGRAESRLAAIERRLTAERSGRDQESSAS